MLDFVHVIISLFVELSFNSSVNCQLEIGNI